MPRPPRGIPAASRRPCSRTYAFFQSGRRPDEAALALQLAAHARRAHVGDLRAEQMLDGVANLNLVGVARHLQHERPAVLAEDGRLLGDERPADDVGQLHDSTSCRRSRAARVAIDSHRVGDVARRHAVGGHELHAGDVPHRQREVLVWASRRRSASCRSTPSPFSSSGRRLGLHGAGRQRVDHERRAPSRSFCASAARSAPFSTFFGSW